MTGAPRTLWEALCRSAQSSARLNFLDNAWHPTLSIDYRGLHGAASEAARCLAGLRLERGSRVGLVAETGPAFLALFHGCQGAGLLPVPLPTAAGPGGRETYVGHLRALIRVADAACVFAPRALRAMVGEAAVGRAVLALEDWADLPPAVRAPAPWGPADPAYVQFSSGSTSAPKGVLISQRAVLTNVAGILGAHGLDVRATERACSWLPLHHDMGLVGFAIAAMVGACAVDLAPPAAFARRPAAWLNWLAAQRATLSYAPASAWLLALRRLQSQAPASGLDLSAMRIAGVGGDMIAAPVLEACMEGLAAHGLSRPAWRPAYGLAEATLAVAMTGPQGAVVETLADPPSSVPTDDGAPTRRVACGSLLPGVELRIRDAEGGLVEVGPDGSSGIGHLELRSDALLQAYLTADGEQDPRDPEGFLDTGDLGCLRRGRLVVTGRSKDVIQIHGRKFWPQDIEAAVSAVLAEAAVGRERTQVAGRTPLRAGDVVVFGLESADLPPDEAPRVVVLIRRPPDDPVVAAGLEERVAAAVTRGFGVRSEVVIAADLVLPRTTSGKLRRQAIRERFLATRPAARPIADLAD